MKPQETATKSERPSFVTDQHLEFLDDLRESGVTNMYGAARYLDDEFPELKERKSSYHSSQKAQDILGYWMKSFGDPNR